ncbi:hypothetical protein CsSME_00040554 [Camellia sinensis var. sinensis]
MEHLIHIISHQSQQRQQQQQQPSSNQLDCRELTDFIVSKFKRVISVLNRTGHAVPLWIALCSIVFLLVSSQSDSDASLCGFSELTSPIATSIVDSDANRFCS